MIELASLIYGIAKDLKEWVEWTDEERLVDFNWPQNSGLSEKAQADGLQLVWSRPDKVASRLSEGYELVFEGNKIKRVRRKIVLKDGSVLLGIRKSGSE